MSDNSNVKVDITASAAGMTPAVSQAEQNFALLQQSASKVDTQFKQTNQALSATTLSAGQLRMATQQLPLQFQDIWVSLAAGQSPMMVLMQQGTQISGSFGGIGNAAKAMGNYLMGLVNPFTVTAAAVAGSAYALYDYASSVNKARLELMQFKDDLSVMSDTAMLKRVLDLRSAVKKAEFEAAQGGFGSIGAADEAKRLNEQLALTEAAYNKLRDAEIGRGDAGGIASKLALESETAKRRELEFNINLLQVYHDKQVAGSTNEIDSLSKLGELKKRLKDMDKPKSGSFDAAALSIENDLFRKQMDLLGVSSAQVRVYELAMRGATKAEVDRAQAAANAIIIADSQIETEKKRKKAIDDSNQILANIDPLFKANQEWEKLLHLKKQNLLTDEQMGKSYANSMKQIEKSGNDAFKSLESAVRGWGSNFTEVMTQSVMTAKADFSGLKNSIIHDLISIQIQKRLTDPMVQAGTNFLDGLFRGSFEGGGYTGSGSRSGGIDGRGGFPAILHPDETVIDHTLNASAATSQPAGASVAPSVVVQVINQSGQNVNARQQGGPQFDGRDWVIGVVLEAMDSNPNFRNALAGAGG